MALVYQKYNCEELRIYAFLNNVFGKDSMPIPEERHTISIKKMNSRTPLQN